MLIVGRKSATGRLSGIPIFRLISRVTEAREDTPPAERKLLMLSLLLTYAYSPIQAQDGDNSAGEDSVNNLTELKKTIHSTELKNSINVFVGGGIGNDDVTSYLAGFTLYDKNNLATTIRYIHHESGWMDGAGQGWDCAVMVGPILKNKQILCSASAGISMMNISDGFNGESEENDKDYSGLGLPLSLHLTWTPLKHLGFGIYTYATFNKLYSMYRLTGTLSVLFFLFNQRSGY